MTDSSDIERAIQDAIRHRAEVDLVHRGSTRRCQPHVLYRDTVGTLLLEAYQVAGHRTSSPLPGWRCIRVDEIEELGVCTDQFQPAPGYNPLNRERYVHLVAWIGQPRAVE